MRVTDPEVRRRIEQTDSEDVLLAFVEIEHENFKEPLRVVNDVVDYNLDGDTYTGILFGFKLLPDGEDVPSTDITIVNIDRRIGRALRPLSGRARVTLAVYSSMDFDLTVIPREPIGSPSWVYRFNRFELVEVDHNDVEVTGKLMRRDPSQEQWPGISLTKLRAPGAWR